MKKVYYTKEILIDLYKEMRKKEVARFTKMSKKEWERDENTPSAQPVMIQFGTWSNFLKEASK